LNPNSTKRIQLGVCDAIHRGGAPSWRERSVSQTRF
jgi:hypothetical protein